MSFWGEFLLLVGISLFFVCYFWFIVWFYTEGYDRLYRWWEGWKLALFYERVELPTRLERFKDTLSVDGVWYEAPYVWDLDEQGWEQFKQQWPFRKHQWRRAPFLLWRDHDKP